MTIYVILYSFLICIAMSMGIFALTLPEVAVYTNMFYYTKNPMISRSNFQNAYLNFNEQAALQEKPLVTEIYFDYYFNEKRELYKFNQEEDYIRLTSLPVKDICLDQSESVVAYYYSYYNSEADADVGAMLVLSTESITMPRDSQSFFANNILWGATDNEDKLSILTKIVFNNIDTSVVVDAQSMFQGCSELEELDVSAFNTHGVTNMSRMFRACRGLTSLDLRSFDTKNVKAMSAMFFNCSGLTSLNLSSFNVENVTSFGEMFYNCQKLTSLDLSSFDTKSAINMYAMFQYCSRLEELNIDNFNTSKVTTMMAMFHNTQIKYLDLSHFDTSQVTDMSYMFVVCQATEVIDISSFDTSKVKNMACMFTSCESLTTIYVGKDWSTDSLTNSEKMFLNCPSLLNWNENGKDIGATYAYAGMNPATGKYGYLTLKKAG